MRPPPPPPPLPLPPEKSFRAFALARGREDGAVGGTSGGDEKRLWQQQQRSHNPLLASRIIRYRRALTD
uniref:Uncharacterized protein n=1 Tax=Vespula pensylvanica TaxID=30213 RepID=A0A834P3W6_VESPE|nr:hypothetical protein H0235_006895 [Vespula pensylvanica]